MKTLIALILCFIAWFCIMVFSCEKATPPKTVSTGVIWNPANASLDTVFDLPTYMEDGIPNPADADLPPLYLVQPCGTWNAIDDATKATLLSGTTAYGRNACAPCHCNSDVTSGYWFAIGDDRFKCIAADGRITSRTTWLANPDNTVIRWNP